MGDLTRLETSFAIPLTNFKGAVIEEAVRNANLALAAAVRLAFPAVGLALDHDGLPADIDGQVAAGDVGLLESWAVGSWFFFEAQSLTAC